MIDDTLRAAPVSCSTPNVIENGSAITHDTEMKKNFEIIENSLEPSGLV